MYNTIFLLFLLVFSNAAYSAPSLAPNSCVQTKQDTCVDSTPCKQFGGVTACLAGASNVPNGAVRLTESCWKYDAAFTCLNGDSIDTCQPLRDKGCGQIGTQCLTQDGSGNCLSAEMTFQCPDKPPTENITVVCDNTYCPDGGTSCFSSTSQPDSDFGRAAAMTEVARQAGVYGVDASANVRIFSGSMDSCTVKTIGGASIKSCCADAGGGQDFNNHAVVNSTSSPSPAATVPSAARSSSVRAKASAAQAPMLAQAESSGSSNSSTSKGGSKYTFDGLFGNSNYMAAGMAAVSTYATSSGIASTLGAMGFEVQPLAVGGFEMVGFDPVSFGAAVAIHIIIDWLSCTTQEKQVQMKKGQNLCTYVSSSCTNKVLGVCTERTRKYCCFNSLLSKLINRQGREQLALDMGTCDGFSQDDFKRLDFSKIDLSEFINSIVPAQFTQGDAQGTATQTVNQKVQDYYGNN